MDHRLRSIPVVFAALALSMILVLAGAQSLLARVQSATPIGGHPLQAAASDDDAQILENQVSVAYTFEAPVVERIAEYDRVTIPGLNSHGEPGAPVLPFQTARILLPYGTDLERIEVRSSGKVALVGGHLIEPGQELRPADSPPLDVLTPPDPSVYSSVEPYPGRLYTQVSVQTLSGYTILYVRLHPVEYVPDTGQIFYHEHLEVIVSTADRADVAQAQEKMLRSITGDAARVQSMVDNPDVVSTYGAVSSGTAQPQTPLVDPAAPNDYILITSSALSTFFQPLVDWKTTKGLAASIVTTDDIYANYGGTDNPDRIRNFIIDAYTAWATSAHPLQYVVLGGDDEIIPVRYVYAPGSGGSLGDWMPSDMYYAGLDGSWDADGDGLYGEDANSGAAGEECDFFAEVYVGRTTVDTAAEATHIVSKTLSYEQNPNADYLNQAMLIGNQLNPITWGGNFKDTVAELIPQYNVTALYQRDGTFSDEDVLAELNTGTHLVNFDGHGNWNCCPLGSSQVNSLINSKYFLFVNLGCNTAAFDQDVSGDSEAVAEHYIYNEHGAFAYIGNTRLGWYHSGSTNGPNAVIDRLFFDTVVNGPGHHIGKALQTAKEDYYSYYSAWRFSILTMTLLGDPETSIVGKFLSPIADITSPAGGNTLKNNIDIIGVAQEGEEAGATFGHYLVEYGSGNAPASWTQIGAASYTSVTNGILVADWDTTVLTDGVYTIRLTVDDGSGRIGQDRAVVNVDNVYITYPPEGDFHRAGEVITVTGTAQGTDFQNYVVEYGRGKSPTDWTWIVSSTIPVTDSVLVVWDTGAISEATYYTLRLIMNGTGHITMDMVTLYVDPTFQDGWPQSAFDRITAPSLAIGDMDGNGDMELVAADYSHVYAWHHDGTLVEGWPLDGFVNRRSSPALADLDRDGDLEVIFGNNIRVVAWHHDGSTVAGWPRGTGGYVDSSPAVEDLDGDGCLEVVVGSQDGQVYIWHHDGTAVDGWPQTAGEEVNATPALGDMDGDGDTEVVVAVSDAVHAWHHDGTTVSGWPVTRSPVWAAASSPALGDIDGDGDIEIVVGGDRVDAWHHDGTAVGGWPRYVGFPSDSSPALGDMDGDGDLEVLVGSDQAYAWHGDGTAVAGWPVALDYTSSSPVLGDIDGDGDPEVLINCSYGDGRLYSWYHDGSAVSGWPRAVPVGDMWMSSPVLEDLDQDGDIEVAIGVEGEVLVWDLPGIYDEANLEWKMFHHDLWHTGFYPPTLPPRISVTPDTLEETLAPGGVAIHTITISNTGEDDLDFRSSASQSGAQLLMHFDEPPGATIFHDGSTNANHGSCAGPSCPVAGVPGKRGTALSFDGVDDYVLVPHHPSWDASEDLDKVTIEASVRIAGWYSEWFSIIDKYEAAADFGWTFQIHSTAGLNLITDPESGGISWCSFVPALGEWHHLVVSYDRDSGKVRFFVNGDLECESDLAADIKDTSGEPLYIGYNPSGGDEYSHGMIDEVVIYDHALSPDEVQALFAIHVAPESGTVSQRTSTPVLVTMDAKDLASQTYCFDLVIQSNDPVTPQVTLPITLHVQEEPITGLIATSNSPTPLGQATALTATITTGSNVSYTWAFGDGGSGVGSLTSHTYPAVGIYTAIVTASNSVSLVTATEMITIKEDIPEYATVNFVADLQGRSNDGGAVFTAWSSGEPVDDCTTASDGACSILLAAGTYSVTAEMASYLDSVWDSVTVSAGMTATLPTVELHGGDANDDCVVNIQDLSFMGYRFNACEDDPLYDLLGDINGDGCINILDLAMAGGNFNQTCPVPW